MAFSWYHSISVQHNQVPSNQSNFPCLVNFTDVNLATVANGGKVQNSSGFDIGFYSDNQATTKLSWEMERYTATTGEVVAWVKLPTISSTPPDTVFYVFYDDPTITTDQSDPVGTWSNGYRSVYHFKDGTTLNVNDTLAQNNGTNNGATATTGQIDGGAAFVSANSQYISCPSLNPGTSFSFEVWINGTTFPNSYNTVYGPSGATQFAAIHVKSTGKLAMYLTATGTVSYDGTGTNTLSTEYGITYSCRMILLMD